MIIRLNRTEISHGWTARPCLNARAHIDERTHYSIIQTVIVAQDFLTIGIAQIVVPQQPNGRVAPKLGFQRDERFARHLVQFGKVFGVLWDIWV
ncbi:hypothetical protein AO072_11040 [Pseudomonas syringae ICMP 13102]|nr:hypothetical protein AO072_11040 [Pseudomonas syringae ICMP 13102]